MRRAGHFILSMDIRAGRARVEVWQHGIRLPDDEALEVILEAYERLRAAKKRPPTA